MGAYRPEAWQTLYATLASSIAALAGLLFVAMSIHIEVIMRSPILRLRSIVNTIGIVLGFTESGAVLVPQAVMALGIEIAILNFLGLLLPVWIAIRLARVRMARVIPKRAAVSAVIFLLGIAGGVALAFDLTMGMFMVTAQLFLNIAFLFFNSWTVMAGVEKEALDKAR